MEFDHPNRRKSDELIVELIAGHRSLADSVHTNNKDIALQMEKLAVSIQAIQIQLAVMAGIPKELEHLKKKNAEHDNTFAEMRGERKAMKWIAGLIGVGGGAGGASLWELIKGGNVP